MSKTAFTVSIFSQTSRKWRSIAVRTMSEAIQLTFGLETSYEIRRHSDSSLIGSIRLTSKLGKRSLARNIHARWRSLVDSSIAPKEANDSDLLKKYHHSKRALLSRWSAKYNLDIPVLRMTDTKLRNELAKSYYVPINPSQSIDTSVMSDAERNLYLDSSWH